VGGRGREGGREGERGGLGACMQNPPSRGQRTLLAATVGRHIDFAGRPRALFVLHGLSLGREKREGNCVSTSQQAMNNDDDDDDEASSSS
jgi:hypothetical protein